MYQIQLIGLNDTLAPSIDKCDQLITVVIYDHLIAHSFVRVSLFVSFYYTCHI